MIGNLSFSEEICSILFGMFALIPQIDLSVVHFKAMHLIIE